ncbi:MAG TPA: hypothetical protein ENH82_00270 [bacterium]|nr:hypothetical protein [bacterium]
MSDIEFLTIKEFDGKLRSDEGPLSVAGDLATLTANSGKDMYIATAKVTYFSNNVGTASGTVTEVVLKLNGVIKETSKYTVNTGSEPLVYEFKNIGQKVAATQIIKLEVIGIDVDTDVEGFIECFEEATGDNPAV